LALTGDTAAIHPDQESSAAARRHSAARTNSCRSGLTSNMSGAKNPALRIVPITIPLPHRRGATQTSLRLVREREKLFSAERQPRITAFTEPQNIGWSPIVPRESHSPVERRIQTGDMVRRVRVLATFNRIDPTETCGCPQGRR